MEEQGEGDQGEGEEEGEGEEVARRMESRMKGEEAAGEAPRELRRGLVEGEAGGSPGWAGEEVERTCPVGMEAEGEARWWELWRREAVAGHLALGQEEEEEGLRFDVGVGEEGHLWLEEVEELEEKKKKSCHYHHASYRVHTF